MARPKGLCAPWPHLLHQLEEVPWRWGAGDWDRGEPVPMRCLHRSYQAALAAPMEGTIPLLWVCLQRGKINPAPGALGIRWSSPTQFYSQDIILCCSPPCPLPLQDRKGNAKHEHPRRRVRVCLWLSEAQENRGTVTVLKPHRAYSCVTADPTLQLQCGAWWGAEYRAMVCLCPNPSLQNSLKGY